MNPFLFTHLPASSLLPTFYPIPLPPTQAPHPSTKTTTIPSLHAPSRTPIYLLTSPIHPAQGWGAILSANPHKPPLPLPFPLVLSTKIRADIIPTSAVKNAHNRDRRYMLGSVSSSEVEGGRYRAPVKGVRSVMYNPNASARNTCSAVHNHACASCIGSAVGEPVPLPKRAASPGGRN